MLTTMKKLTILLVTIVFVFIACAPVDKTDTEADSKAISDVFSNMKKAFNEANYEAWMRNMDVDAIMMPPNGPSLVGIEAIGSFYNNYFKNYTSIISNGSIEGITVSGDYGFAVENWEGSMNPVDGSDPVNFNNKILCIYKRQTDGSWLLYRGMWNSNETP